MEGLGDVRRVEPTADGRGEDSVWVAPVTVERELVLELLAAMLAEHHHVNVVEFDAAA
ncbi:MAG TPA: hypothetical protein VGA36_03245 [Nitriliruptorales bacterium]